MAGSFKVSHLLSLLGVQRAALKVSEALAFISRRAGSECLPEHCSSGGGGWAERLASFSGGPAIGSRSPFSSEGPCTSSFVQQDRRWSPEDDLCSKQRVSLFPTWLRLSGLCSFVFQYFPFHLGDGRAGTVSVAFARLVPPTCERLGVR